MTLFDFVTQDADTLAAFIYGLIDETEKNTINKIECMTGITICTANLAPEIRIAEITKDLLEEKDASR